MKLIGKRIFIVEDNTMNRITYQMILKLSGAVLEFDRWGRDTLYRLKGFEPDLIIMDLMITKGRSGFDIFDDIRKHPEYDAVPIVAISASEPAVSLPLCRDKGFDGFIVKPVDDELLPDQLARLIEGEQIWYIGERYGGEIR
jgi:two-component system, sensor histidine kinase and response regulator